VLALQAARDVPGRRQDRLYHNGGHHLQRPMRGRQDLLGLGLRPVHHVHVQPVSAAVRPGRRQDHLHQNGGHRLQGGPVRGRRDLQAWSLRPLRALQAARVLPGRRQDRLQHNGGHRVQSTVRRGRHVVCVGLRSMHNLRS
jgi:hypothetical protein